MKTTAIAISCAVLLAGCSQAPNWRDETGHNRSQDDAVGDLHLCYGDVGYLANNPSKKAMQDYEARVLKCMAKRGWSLISRPNLT